MLAVRNRVQGAAREMDPPPSSSEISVDTQAHHPQPAASKHITQMGVDLQEAAALGKIDEFTYPRFELESLLTPNQNTVLHVHLATYDPLNALGSEKKFYYRMIFDLMSVSQDGFGRRSGESFRSLIRALVPSSLQNENFKFINQILKKCPSLLLQPNASGQTPLHIAASNGHSYVVKFLINYKAKASDHEDQEKQGTEMQSVREMLRVTDLESNTPLHVAAQHGHLQVVKELLEFEDADFQYPVNTNQETPLYVAARRGYHSLLAVMLEKFKSPNLGGPHGRTVLHAAAMTGDAKTTRTICEKSDLARETDENGQTPLHYAAHLGHKLVVEELLKRDKLTAYICDEKWAMTPLLMAARQGHEGIVKVIIYFCPECCEVVDKRGRNLFHFLAFRGIFLGVKWTTYAPIKDLMYKKDTHGITPQQLFDAYRYGQRERLSREKMLELIVKIKTVAETPVGPVGDQKDVLTKDNQGTEEKTVQLQIAKLLDDFLNEEVAEKPVRPVEDDAWFNAETMKDRKDAHMVVATLIATVTFASAITVPGGYKSDNGPDQGTPFLIHNKAFKAFLISDAVAFMFSLIAIAVHFPRPLSFSKKRISFKLAEAFIGYAVAAMLIAFGTATYAVMQPSPALAISTYCIGLFFFYILYCVASDSSLN